jgi:hypothetical protein
MTRDAVIWLKGRELTLESLKIGASISFQIHESRQQHGRLRLQLLESVTQSWNGRFETSWWPRDIRISLLHEEITFPALTDETVERLQESPSNLFARGIHEYLPALLLRNVGICYDETLNSA